MKSRSVRESHKERRNTPHYDRDKNPFVKDYYLVDHLGTGAFGRCFKAYHVLKNKYYAMKVSPISTASSNYILYNKKHEPSGLMEPDH